MLKASANKKQAEKSIGANRSIVEDNNSVEQLEEIPEEENMNVSIDETKSKKRRIMDTEATAEEIVSEIGSAAV